MQYVARLHAGTQSIAAAGLVEQTDLRQVSALGVRRQHDTREQFRTAAPKTGALKFPIEHIDKEPACKGVPGRAPRRDPGLALHQREGGAGGEINLNHLAVWGYRDQSVVS